MHKRFQIDEHGQQMEGDGQVKSSNHLPIFYDKPQLINEGYSLKQGFNTGNKEKISGNEFDQSRLLCTDAENENKSKLQPLFPDAAMHFSINDYDDEMLIPVNSMVDGYSKSGMDNPVALGPDQGYPNGCESSRGANDILTRSSLNVTSKIKLDKMDKMFSNTDATKDNNQSQMREVWTKLYGKSSTKEETSFGSSLQSPHSVQVFSVGNQKSGNNFALQISSVANESHTMKSDVPTVHRRPVAGNHQLDKSIEVQNLPSNIFSTSRTIPETLKDKQNEEKVPGLKMNYQQSSVTSSDIVFFDVMNNMKYRAEDHNQKRILKRKQISLSKNKTLLTNFSPVLHNQSKNQFIQNPTYNIEGNDQSILDINDSIFDYSTTGSISENSSISTNLPMVPALSSSSSSIDGSKSTCLDEKESTLGKAANSSCVNEEKPLHTKMTQPSKKSLGLENFNVPNKQIPLFSSRSSQQCHKDTCTDDGSMSFDIDDTILTVESIESDTEQLKVQMPRKTTNLHINNMDDITEQLDNLTFMYQQLLDLISQNKMLQIPSDQPRSIANSKTNSQEKVSHYLQRRKSMRSTILETKHNKKHFQQLEAHIVTLVQSVATLTTQVQAHTNTLKQIDILKEELQDVKENLSNGNNYIGISSLHNKLTEYERFRGWIPSLTNPKRVRKLTKFFGQEPPLLEIFLKKLGYERYISNFSNEHIGMLELPYMTEERLQNIGIPMGPRLRILQESQLCFRQENFNIYII